MQSIEWRPVVGYEGYYEVSSIGQVRSVTRVIHVRNQADRTCPGKILKLTDDTHGYLQAGLYVGSRGRHIKVHRLVAEAFIRPGNPGEDVRHLDGDRLNNRADNFAWGTRAENMQDAVRHGTTRGRFSGVTHCINGHAFTEENTYTYRGVRACKTCRVATTRAWRAERAEAGLYASDRSTP